MAEKIIRDLEARMQKLQTESRRILLIPIQYRTPANATKRTDIQRETVVLDELVSWYVQLYKRKCESMDRRNRKKKETCGRYATLQRWKADLGNLRVP